MFVYIIYLLFLLSVIAFSPTRYFSFSVVALLSAIPGILYCVVKFPSKLQTCLLVLFGISIYSGYHNSFDLEYFNRKLTNFELIASSSIWLVSYITIKLAMHNRKIYKGICLKIFFVVFFLIGVELMTSELMHTTSVEEGSNSVYYVLPVLPCMMFFFQNKKFSIMLLVCLLIFFSIKRSAFLIIAVSIVCLMFCSYKGIININKYIMNLMVLTVIFIILFANIGAKYFDAIVERFVGIAEDGGSHRDLIFEYAFGLIHQFDITHLLLGSGPRYFWACSQNISAAHNDFLEIVLSCGLVGLGIFFIIHVRIIKLLSYYVRQKSQIAISLGISYITFLIWNLIACQFAYQSGAICTFMFWGIAEYYEKDKNIIYSH